MFKRYIALGFGVVAAGFVALLVVSTAGAQSVTPDLLRSLQRGQGDSDSDFDDERSTKPQVQTFQPAVPPANSGPPSHLEDLYSKRASETLTQFGYDALGVPTAVSITQSGAIPDGYIMEPDDELVVQLRGQENASYRVHVDRDGRVTLPKLLPILAAGRRFGEFRRDLEAQVAHAYISTQVFVTLGEIHQLSVLVAGEVRAPGVRNVSGLASPLDVILLSGGIKKTGSLRNVKVVSGGYSRTVDLYSVVAQGGSANLGQLRDGDRIYVPPIGATVAVSGQASRPAIYELPPGASGIRAADLLRLAGGAEIAGAYDLAKVGVERDGDLSLGPMSKGGLVRNGEVLVVSGARSGTVGRVWVRGETAVPGVRSLSAYPTVASLFHSVDDLTANAYGPFAILRRRDPLTNSFILIPISITAAIQGSRDVGLQNEDAIFVLDREFVAALSRVVTENLNSAYAPTALKEVNATASASPASSAAPPGSKESGAASAAGLSGNTGFTPSTPNQATQPDNVTIPAGAAAMLGGDIRYNGARQGVNSEAAALAQSLAVNARNGTGEVNTKLRTDQDIVDAASGVIGVTSDALLRLATDNLVWVMNEVREPGPYLSAGGTSISDIIHAAGGVQQTADLSDIEVTSTEVDQRNGVSHTTRQSYNGNDGQIERIVLHPLDVIRLRTVYTDRDEGTVTVAGEVRFPGVFDITRDERLSTLLQRAGGMSEVAYPYGAIFTRKQAALNEKEGYERTARQLESQIPILLSRQSSDQGQQTSTGEYLSTLARDLRDTPALGRIVITADPAVLATKPELDFVLQPGDTLYIPKRPSDVTVSGEVLSPGSFQYRAGLRFGDYVHMAGGETQAADNARTFIVMPDGSAAPADDDWLSFGGRGRIPPGSTIVVPRDIAPFDWSEFLKDASQIVSQLAITAASLSVLSQNK